MQPAFLIDTHRPHFPGWFTAHMSRLVPSAAVSNQQMILFNVLSKKSATESKNSHRKCEQVSVSCKSLFTLQIDHLATSKIQVSSFPSLLSVRGISWPAGWWMWRSLLLSFSKSLLVVLSKSFSKSLLKVLSSSLPQKRISAVDIEVGQQQKSDSSTF